MLSFLTALVLAIVTPPEEPPGERIELGEARLFIPRSYDPDGDTIDVLLHLHGAPSVVEPAVVACGSPAVLVEFNRQGLSSVYARPFADPSLFPRLLEQTIEQARLRGLSPRPKLGRVTVSSFSAGFGGVRELLKVPEHVRRIDGLIMADSLYAGYTGDPAEKRVDPALVAGFEAFARQAAEGRKRFLLTHSAQVPGNYASTTETADALLVAVGGRAESVRRAWSEGWVQVRSFERGGLRILGFAGDGPEDHMKHLRQIAAIWGAYFTAPGPEAPDRTATAGPGRGP